MNESQLASIVQAGESETLEFKRTTGALREAAHTICAFVNGKGGQLIFGVDDAGALVGQQVSGKTIEDIANELREIEPPVLPRLDRVRLANNREAVVVTVQPAQNRPHTHRHRAYRRLGNTTRELSHDEYNQMLMESLHGQRRWENEPADGWTVEHLDTAELVRTIEEAIRRGRAEDPGSRDPAMILRGLGLTRNGTILRAAAMLFGKSSRLEQEFPQCLLRVARFRGTDTTTFEDNRQFHGNAFRLLRRAERFLREHLPIAGRIVPELFQRIDDPLYPPVALREAIANAICHRDYTIGGGSIAVAIFDDRLEITSSGTLHFGLTVDALFGPHESLPWNPLIARVFYKCGIIEQWGRGTVKMVELAQQAGLPRPEIEEQAGRVTVRFRASGFASPARVVHEFSDRQRAILQLLQQQGRMALRDLKSALKGEALWAIKEDLSQLKSLGQVETGGHGRGAFWRLTKPSTQ